MKWYLVLLACVLALAEAERDWSKIISLDIEPPFVRKGTVKQRSTRIVGGVEAVPHSIPYQVGLFVTVPQGVAFCGGSILNANHILTAAHCVDQATQAEVVLGAHQIRNESEPTQVRINTTSFVVHPMWSPLFLQNDIAIIKLFDTIQYTAAIQPVVIPTQNNSGANLGNVLAKVSGWGKDSDSATGISPVLRYVENNLLTDLLCRLSFLGITSDKNLCLSGSQGKGACSGDSGGPLVTFNKDGSVVQQGVVSFGSSLGCSLGLPSAFTRVDKFLDFIAENINAECYTRRR